MDESEKRKKRLIAMRMEASQAVIPDNVENSAVPAPLSNPFNEEASSNSTVQDNFRSTPRFDYYTDPMAAYSGNRTRARSDNQSTQNHFTPPVHHQGPRNYDANPPVHCMQSQYSHDQGKYQPQGPHSSFTAPGIRSPPYMHHGNSGAQANANYYSSDSAVSPGGTFPRVWNPSNAPRYCNSPSPGFSPANNPYGRARPQMFGNTPVRGSGCGGNPGRGGSGGNSGRGGRGYGGSTNHGIGRSGGRGLGFHGRSSTSNMTIGPEHFYDESMLEDPWQHLEPVLWRRREVGTDDLSAPDSNSWLPKSISSKKAKVSEASNSNQFNSQQSLAEFLAASFNKAVEDTQNE